MDNILVHSKSQEEHDRRLLEVLRRLKKAGITLNEKKSVFSQDQVKFLGQIIDHAGVRPDPEKVSARRLILWPRSHPATEAGGWRDEASRICF